MEHERSQTLSIRDKITFSIAFLILGSFFLFYGITVGVNLYSGSNDYTGIEKVASTLAPIAATVIGYYFGQRPVRTLVDKLQDAAKTTGVATQGVERSVDARARLIQKNEELKGEIENLKQAIEIQGQVINDYERRIRSANQ
jgi:hypothetical protein